MGYIYIYIVFFIHFEKIMGLFIFNSSLDLASLEKKYFLVKLS